MDHEQLQKLIKLMSSLKSKVQCPICLDFPVHVAELPCTHMFCNNCISQLRSEINPKCPICLTLISRRAVCYKDQFANKLSKFVNDVCQLIKEKYAYEVDELCSNKYDLKKIIELAPQEFCKTTALIHGKAEQSPEGFDLLKPGIRKCYFNKKRESLKNKLLDIADRKSKVVNWLNNNQQETLNLLVTSDQCSSHEEGDFQMPSISQVISESRVEKENLKTCQDYEHVKLKEVMDHTDDYNIEETPSEALARQVERKVVQEILEDECLANLERIAKLDKNLGEKPTNSKNATSVLTEQTKDKRRSSGKQCISPNDSGSSSGWERMENFTKSIKKRCKGYKQLKIHQGGGVRKEKRASRNRQDQPAKQNSKKQLKLEVSRGQDASDGVQKNCVEEKESPNREMVILINKNISLDMEKNYLGIVKDKKAATEAKHKKTANLTDKPLKKVTDQLVNSTDSDNDDIFYLATQLTPDTINRQTNLYLISPVPDELDNVNDVAVRLSDHLKSCAGIANLNNSKGLANCFTDLLSYANRIVKNSSRKVQKKVATTQTVLVNSTVAVQTELLNENKHVQTINKMLQSVATDMSVNKAIQTSGNNLGNIVEGDKTNPDPPENYYPINSNESEAILASQSQLSKSRRSVTQSSPNQVVRKAKHISQDFKRKKVLHISTDESKESKLTKSSNQISEGSVLTYSLDSPKSSVKRTNSKFRKSQNRKFKRIRELNVNSDSDESGNPSKRKFVRDDLTVEFADTEPSDRNEAEVQFTLDSEKMDYDGYLLEVMKNYDAAPSNMRNPKKEETLTNQSINCNKQVVTNTDVQTQKSKCAPDTGDHIFTACLALEENFCKFDNEILEFEKSVKTCNTEMDVVENTPGISPKSKRISRLPSKKNSLVRPDLIPTKGSTSSFSEKNIGLTEDLLRSIVGPSTLNRKFENVHSQTGKLTEDVRDILSELKGNEEFFENEDSVDDVGDTNIETRTQNNIDKNLHEFDDDQEMEGILKQISVTGDESSSSKPNGIVILQNIKIKSQNKTNKTPDDVICSSDEEIIETTPQKKKSTSKDRSVLENLPLEQNGFCGDPDDNLSGLYLPPPPGFDDAPSISQCNEKENCDPSSSFLTPDQFTDFLVTPDENINHSENPNDLDTSVATLNRPAVKKLMNLKLSRRMFINDQENILSPIPQSSKPVAESNHNPLVYIPRLSLKKPTLMTSTPNQKSILNYVVSSSSEDGSGKQSQKSKPCIMWSRILNKDLNIFTQLECKKLLTTSKVFNSRVTHVIVLVDEKGQIVSHTAKILQAIAAGIWVVRYEWAVDCLRMNRIVPEDPYEALDVSGVPGPQKSRLSDKSDPLFKKFRFYCAPPLESISKGDLQSILQLAGGEIVEDQADLLIKDGKICMILTESSASEETEQYEEWLEIYKAVTVDVEWLSVCIGQYEVVSFRPYLVTGDETAVCDLGYPLTLIQSVSFSLTEPS